jgi:hypothetical protein
MSFKLDVREEAKPTPVYSVGTVLKLSKALRGLRVTDVKYVKVYPDVSESGCTGCFFKGLRCSTQLNIACAASNRKGDRFPSVIFVPCDSKGRDCG